MKKVQVRLIKSLLLLGFIVAQNSYAQLNEQVDTRACAQLQSAQDRLSCYDALQPVDLSTIESLPEKGALANSTEGFTSSEIVETAPEGMPDTVLTTNVLNSSKSKKTQNDASIDEMSHDKPSVNSFGFERKIDTVAEIRASEDGKLEFFDTISGLKKRGDGMWEVTLKSGQVWRQQVSAVHYNLRVGQEIKIYPSTWKGAYRLTALTVKGFIQVKRIR